MTLNKNLMHQLQANALEETEEVAIAEDLDSGAKLIVFNDDFNTFDFVIKSLVSICKLDAQQAEQLTLIIHYKGKATVKEGDESTLFQMCRSLVNKGLTAEVVI